MIIKYYKFISILLICITFSCGNNTKNNKSEIDLEYIKKLITFLKIDKTLDSNSIVVVPPLICLQCEEGLINLSSIDKNLTIFLSNKDTLPKYLKENKVIRYDEDKMVSLGLNKLYSVHYIFRKTKLVYRKALIK
jgi:hypothetical protein